MGKLVQVKSGQTVSLPPIGIYYDGGNTTTLTDQEYLSLTADQLDAIVVVADNLADPIRSTNPDQPSSLADTLALAKQYTDDATRGLDRTGDAVADATDTTDVVTQFNSLLASLRTAGIIGT